MTTAKKETLGFQSEAKQLMQLMIHSLYSNKEIFLRELVSNANDAIDKLRFESLSNTELASVTEELRIRIDVDKDANTVTITDNGIGMTREEAISHLGTIAKSGTAQFLDSLTGDQKQDSQLIGQFGVGFYSGFLVANKIEVSSKGFQDEEAERKTWKWTSQGSSFTLQEAPEEALFGEQSGTKIVLHLREEAQEYLDSGKIGRASCRERV